ncbi:MFS transporter [Shouchella lonarensis]|uniref:Major Facilitator Superfamily protein n=1 Tax=Shouchella lonarensis TaxID=1464122 RepID=A0A1G6GTC9_9BACI|nr:MFS transporter [Shouchella lonarensis]SDB85280.1 Major Facilitator Superfamily protein [Shouchella lonarensis]
MNHSLWSLPHFRKLWLSQNLNVLSSILLQVVVMIEVYKRTNSIFGSSVVLATISLGLFLGGIVASNHIDRFPLKKVMQVCGWMRAVLVIIIGGVLFIDSPVMLVVLYVILFAYSFVNAWYQPARFAMLPLIIEKGQYMQANGTLVLARQILMTAGWGLGGFIAMYVPLTVTMVSIALFYVISSVVIGSINVNEDAHVRGGKRKGSNWAFVLKNPIVRAITIMDAAEALANAIWTSALLLAFTTSVLMVGEAWWGFLNAGYFVGAILGGLIVTLEAKRFSTNIGVMIGLGGISMGIFTILFSLNTIPLLAVVMCILMGPMYQVRDVCQVTVLQHAIPAEKRASVMATRSAILTPWNGIAVLIMGFLADVVKVQFVFLFAGGLYVGVALLAFLIKSLRKYKMNHEQNEEIQESS